MKFTVKSIALSGVALGMFVSAANAADAVVLSSDWTGFSIGVGGGGTFNFSNTTAAGGGGMHVSGSFDSGDGSFDQFVYGSSGSSNYGELRVTNDDNSSGYGYAEMFSAATIGGEPAAASAIAYIVEHFSDSGYSSDGNPGDNDTGMAGFMGTARAGYDHQFGSFVFGLDAAYNFGKTEISNGASAIGGGYAYASGDGNGDASGYGSGAGGLTSSLELGNSWSVGGRAGFLVSESTLLFGSAGYQQTKATLSARFSGYADAGTVENGDAEADASAGFDISASESEWMDGFYVGAGIEQLLSSNISLKLEYRFSDLGSIETSNEVDESLSGSGYGGHWMTAVEAEAEPTVHAVTATINFRF
jgi:opacity protein-like surface antigen